MNEGLPSTQADPFHTSGVIHAQVNDPGVSIHGASIAGQLCRLCVHSSTASRRCANTEFDYLGLAVGKF